MQAWLEATYQAIEAQAKAEGGEIHWGDETAVINTDVRGRSYAPKGEAPVAYAPGSRNEVVNDLGRHQSGQDALDDN